MIVNQIDRQYSWDYADRNPLVVNGYYFNVATAPHADASLCSHTVAASRKMYLGGIHISLEIDATASALGVTQIYVKLSGGSVTTAYWGYCDLTGRNTLWDKTEIVLPGNIIINEGETLDIRAVNGNTGGTMVEIASFWGTEFDV